MALHVALDTAPLQLNRAGEARYARDLLAALRTRDDVRVTTVGPGRRRPGTLAQRVALQGAVQGAYYPAVQPRQVHRAGARLLHLPRNLVPPQPGLRVPAVVTVHDVLPLRAPHLFSPVIRANFRLLTPGALRRAAHVICGSQYTRRETAELLDVAPEKITVTPWGIDPRFRRAPMPEAVLRERFAITGPFVLCVGTLEPRKNLAGAVRAYTRLAADDHETRLVIVGGHGWDRGEVAEAARTAGDRVVLTGYVTDEELVGLLGAARCFLYPSFFEGFGFPPLEAMACGTPVVTSDRASLPEVVGDAALVVDPEDGEGLAAALARVLHEPGLAADLRERGLRRAALYSWARCAEATVSVYRAVAG